MQSHWQANLPNDRFGNAMAITLRNSPHRIRPAFTLTEMMIAMAVTLLLMAALGKTFALMGDNIRQGRVKVELTSQLRDITHRMNSDIQRCTVSLAPPSDDDRGDGYFVYYEGPLTDATGVLMGQSPSATNENSYQDSKFGDLDDYIAMTSVAEAGNWFRGKVPRFILDKKSVDVLPANQDASATNDIAYDPTSFPGNPYDPIVITSKYAEIAYFASPEYAVSADADDPTKFVFAYNSDPIGNPQYIDDDGNGLPDRIRLHRRVLLIRPDLVLTSPTDAVGTAGTLPTHVQTFGSQVITYMSPDGWSVDTSTSIPAIKTPATHGISRPQTPHAWMIGMAPIHQQCDLSVRRGIGVNGMPNASVIANSLADLTAPENRFAHVRMPGSLVNASHNSANPFSTMPILAMGALPNILDPATNAAVPSSGNVITPNILNGFIRPEFVLGMDHTHTEVFGDGWGMERLSEDVIATSVLGFNVKGFDATAPSLMSFGSDGQPGIANYDDDADGDKDNPQKDASGNVIGISLEAGFIGSDDVVVTTNDPAMRETLLRSVTNPGEVSFSQAGDFVDLFYPYNAGGTIRGPAAVQLTRHTTVASPAAIPISRFLMTFGLDSHLSGTRPRTSLTPTQPLYTEALLKSGKVVLNASGGVLMVQPTFDTFSNHYERDGFWQTFPSNNGSTLQGTVWYAGHSGTGASTSPLLTDIAANGIDDDDANGADDEGERETSAPFTQPLPAIKVSLRLEENGTRQVEQMSSVTHFVD